MMLRKPRTFNLGFRMSDFTLLTGLGCRRSRHDVTRFQSGATGEWNGPIGAQNLSRNPTNEKRPKCTVRYRIAMDVKPLYLIRLLELSV